MEWLCKCKGVSGIECLAKATEIKKKSKNGLFATSFTSLEGCISNCEEGVYCLIRKSKK